MTAAALLLFRPHLLLQKAATAWQGSVKDTFVSAMLLPLLVVVLTTAVLYFLQEAAAAREGPCA
jgi:hypothetical protein